MTADNQIISGPPAAYFPLPSEEVRQASLSTESGPELIRIDTYSADSPEYDKSATIRDWQERPEGYKVFASVYSRGYSGVSIIRLPADQEMTVSSSNTKQKTKGGSSVAQLLFIATNCGELRGEGTRLMDHVKSWADAEGYPITPSLNDEDNASSCDSSKV